MTKKRIKQLKNLFIFFQQNGSEKDLETFLDLVSIKGYELMALDFLNCFLILHKKEKLLDIHIKYILEFDIIMKYSPKKRKLLS